MSAHEIEAMRTLLASMPGRCLVSVRMVVLHLGRMGEGLVLPWADGLQIARACIVTCSKCGARDTTDPWTICADPRRDDRVVCVVEDVGDLWALERAKATKGRYHVLGGVLSALDGVGPEDLSLAGLKTRCVTGVVKEVILATNATVEGQSTAHYIMDMLKGCDVPVSRLAHGVPVGGELDYLDDGTLAEAMKSRTEF